MEAAQTTNPPTLESIMAILDGITQRLKDDDKRREEAEKEAAKRREEAEKEAAKRQEEAERNRAIHERRMKVIDEKLGAMTNLFGDVTEAMIVPELCDKFEEHGLIFPKANTNSRVNDRINKIYFETDIMLENGDKAMLIEVKTKLTIERIKYHMERMEKMRIYANLHGDKRIFLGAVAGIVIPAEVRAYALNQGFYLIEPSGDDFNIIPPNGNPKEW